MSNPFHDGLDGFRGERVRVTGTNGTTYIGWVKRVHHRDRHVHLRDATHVATGQDCGDVVVAHADEIVECESEGHIKRVSVDAIQPAPYHVDGTDTTDEGYVRHVRDVGFAGSYPIVREIDGGYECIEGHTRLWVCRQAGLDTHPVEVVDVDDWTVAQRFVRDHYPLPDADAPSGRYDDAALRESLEAVVDEWGIEARELPTVAGHLDRLDLRIEEAALVSADETGAPTPQDLDDDAEQGVEPIDGDGIEAVAAGEAEDEESSAPLAFEPGEEIGAHTANESRGSTYLYLGVDVVDALQERAETVADRVTVRERDGGYELVPGPSEEWPDYSVGADSITIGKPGCRVLEVSPDGEVQSIAGEDVVRLIPPATPDDEEDDAGESDDILEDAADWTPENGTAEEEDLVSLATPDAGASRECQNCGSEVSKRYVDVFAPDGVDQPRCCPNCDDLVRDGNGVREKRT